MTDTDFTRAGAILRPFPPAADVFAPDAQDLARHLHPLVSVDLSAADPAWAGWAHILSPPEAVGLLGEHGRRWHNDWQRENALIFRMEGDRYRLDGDRRYFLLAQDRARLPSSRRRTWDEVAAAYLAAERSYAYAARSWAERGRLLMLDEAGAPIHEPDHPQPLVNQLGGTTGFGNWAAGFPYALDEQDPDPTDPDDYGTVWPLSPAGRRFHLVAEATGFYYRGEGADAILLFFEPVERLALLTFDWS